MSSRSRVVLAMLALAAEGPLSAQQSSDDPTFKVEVSLVHVLVTVKDPSGAPIADLERDDFTVLDGGVERRIAVFERRTNRPLSVALMVDTSLSTAKELDFERESAKRFVRNLLGPGSHRSDRVGVFQFSVYVELLTGFTASTKRLDKALDRIRADSGTSMYDGILLAARQLRRRPGRKVMIIITDGGDTTSNVPYRKALREAHAVDAVIYGIIVMPITADAGRNVGGENALKALAASTGGTTFVQHAGADLDRAFNEILRNLRTQYLIAYYPPEGRSAAESFRETSITVSRPEARVLARNGYFVPAAPKAPPRGTAKRTADRSSLSRPKSPESRAKAHTLEEANYLKRLIEKEIPVLLRLRDNEEVVGIVESHDSTSIRVSRQAAPDRFVLKNEIKYFHEQPETRS